MFNMQGLMKQAQMMQKKMNEAQEKLAQSEVTGVSGGGMVKVTITGKMATKKVDDLIQIKINSINSIKLVII